MHGANGEWRNAPTGRSIFLTAVFDTWEMKMEMYDYTYLIRRKVFSFLGAAFHIYDPSGRLIGFSKQKAFKLKEDIRVYTDESKQQELLVIKARNIIDFSASYDVFDPAANMLLGIWQRKGFSSMLRDKWALYDFNGVQIGEINEDQMSLALVRRFVCNVIPQNYSLMYGSGQEAAAYSQCFNPFVFKLKVRINPGCTLSPHLILAGGILLAAIEGRQS